MELLWEMCNSWKVSFNHLNMYLFICIFYSMSNSFELTITIKWLITKFWEKKILKSLWMLGIFLFLSVWFRHQCDSKSLGFPSSGKTARLVRESLNGFLQHEPTLQMASKSHMLGLNVQPTFELQHTKSKSTF